MRAPPLERLRQAFKLEFTNKLIKLSQTRKSFSDINACKLIYIAFFHFSVHKTLDFFFNNFEHS